MLLNFFASCNYFRLSKLNKNKIGNAQSADKKIKKELNWGLAVNPKKLRGIATYFPALLPDSRSNPRRLATLSDTRLLCNYIVILLGASASVLYIFIYRYRVDQKITKNICTVLGEF